jgi:regulator of ribosome biosynthesis
MTQTAKADDLLYDLGNLCAVDTHPIDFQKYKKDKNEYIKETARENLQLLFNKLFELPTQNEEDGLFAKLPKPTTKLPREKPVPKQKEQTRWEEFAKEKNLRARNREKMVFDPLSQEFRPRFGWQRAKDTNGDWVVEAKPHEQADPEMDPFLAKMQEKKKKLANQKKNELKNAAKNDPTPAQIKIANVGKLDARSLGTSMKSDFGNTYDVARLSTASMGKFDKRLNQEAKNEPLKTGKEHYKPVELASSKKRKRSNSSANTAESERESSMNILNRVLKVQSKRKQQVKQTSVSLYQRSAEKDKRKEKKKHLLGENKARFKPNKKAKYE